MYQKIKNEIHKIFSYSIPNTVHSSVTKISTVTMAKISATILNMH